MRRRCPSNFNSNRDPELNLSPNPISVPNPNPFNPTQVLELTGGGAHGIVTLATHADAFHQAIGMARSRGTIVCVGLPPGDFGTPIFETVLKGLTIRGSIVGE